MFAQCVLTAHVVIAAPLFPCIVECGKLVHELRLTSSEAKFEFIHRILFRICRIQLQKILSCLACPVLF